MYVRVFPSWAQSYELFPKPPNETAIFLWKKSQNHPFHRETAISSETATNKKTAECILRGQLGGGI
jgi:hypothetical protein